MFILITGQYLWYAEHLGTGYHMYVEYLFLFEQVLQLRFEWQLQKLLAGILRKMNQIVKDDLLTVLVHYFI
jgi:hypothetical protein